MNNLKSILEKISNKKSLLFSLVIIILIAIALVISYSSTRDQLTQIDEKKLIVGGGNSPTHLMLSTLFHYETPPENISYDIFQELKQDDRVAKAIPLALGDNYKNHRIVGTDYSYFVGSKKSKINDYLAEGDFFKRKGEAVLGAKTAEKLELEVGSKFQGSHGVKAQEDTYQHDFTYEVVGILKDGLANDDYVIFTDIESVWRAHQIYSMHFPFDVENTVNLDSHRDDDYQPCNHLHGSDGLVASFPEETESNQYGAKHNYDSNNLELTAILLKAKTTKDLEQLEKEIKQTWQVQAVKAFEAAQQLLNILKN